jgi:3-hydroxyisobutyrate dehydrogenase-like beta-hydroxyacid dehydrogenase
MPSARLSCGLALAFVAAIGVIGLGAMGSRIARRLLDARHDLVVWNRSPEKLEPLVASGAEPAASPAEAAERADAVITMVADPNALRAVTEGPSGVAAGAGDSTTVIEMSTVGPPAVARLASVLGEDAQLIDAPVLGSLSEAEAGTLKVFAGGPAPLVEQWTPVLSALGEVLHVGPLGCGAAAKLVANSTLFGVLAVLGEALALAQELGLSQEAAFEVLAASPLAAQAERRRESVESGRFPVRFALELARKDANLISEVGLDLRAAEGARGWIAEADDAGWSDRDYSAVLAWILGRR